MSRMFGTVVRGVRAPIFREGDDVVKGTVDTVLKALKENGVEPHDKDVVAITESVVARTQGNYATVEQIAADVRARGAWSHAPSPISRHINPHPAVLAQGRCCNARTPTKKPD